MENEVGENQPQTDTSANESQPLTKREKRRLAKRKKQEERIKSGRKEGIKKWVIRLFVLLLLGFAGYKLWQWIGAPRDRVEKGGSGEILRVKADDWVKGDPNAKVTLIEYADFECPACAIYSTEIIKKLMDEYKDDLRVVYRHFPLPQHTRAVDAAKAGEAAGKQGKFWQMSDLLYSKQADWSTGNIKEKMVSYAESIGLNVEQFEKDYESDAVFQSIKDNEAEGYKLGINETPTFYINGKKISINNGLEDLQKAINEALSAGN